MSINSAMQSGVTALAANAAALASISSNIANSNTTGYKELTTSFTDLVSGSASSNNYSSGGVVAVNRQSVTTQGDLNSDTSGYSLGIDGQGFFVVSDSASDVTSGSSLLFTRDGSFSTDTDGNLVNSGGYYLLGWAADANGDITSSATDANLLVPINVNDLASAPSATTAVSFAANVNSTTTVSEAVTSNTYDPASTAMSVYDSSTGEGTKPDATISTSVSDSLGQEHTVTVSLLKGNIDTDSSSATYGKTQWYYEVSSDDVTSDDGLNQITSGSLWFDSSGALDTENSTGDLVSATGLTIGASSETSGVHWDAEVGAEGQSITMGFQTGGASSLTQLATDTTTSSITANGTEFGSLASVDIGSDGMVTATYSNGHTRTLAQVALATFVNANGLTAVSGNAYAVSTESGTYSLKAPGEGGAGTIEADTLEASTVDLAQSFTSLITVQRAYSAASKVVTTADEMLQELLSLKR